MNLNDYLKAQIQEQCTLVQRGVKPLSMLSYQERYHNEVVELVKESKLHFKTETNSKGWGVLYIYRNEHLAMVINELPKEAKTASEHYLLGALFGYDTDSICDFIFKNQFKRNG
jgi:hypothetical protein